MAQFKTARLSDSDLGNTIDNGLGGAETDAATILGIPTNTDITNPMFEAVAGGLNKVILQDAAADPAAAGVLLRNATLLKYHDGAAVQTLARSADIGPTTNAYGLRTVQAGGSPSGGNDGDTFWIY